VASTGRLSSSDPNLQNIPVRSEIGRRIRAAFVARDAGSRLVSADYSQIELRLLAHLSGDPGLVAAFEAGGDVHTLTAARIAGCSPAEVTAAQRAAAKTVNFGVVYGMGPRGLAERLGISLEEARRFIDDYFASYPSVRRCTQELVEQARARGYARTILGRRLGIPELGSDQPARRAAAERLAVNAPIQGSAADLVKVAMVRVHARLGAAASAARLVLQVHDELVLDVPENEVEFVTECVRHEMAAALPLRVPIVVDVGVGRNWAEAH
jgi:DNA polymerase-1